MNGTSQNSHGLKEESKGSGSLYRYQLLTLSGMSYKHSGKIDLSKEISTFNNRFIHQT